MALTIQPQSIAGAASLQTASPQTPPPPRTAAQRLLSPTLRDLRARATHRLQVGLFGLCAMLLIVGLANIIMNRARLAERQNPPVATMSAPPVQTQASDPLADIGLVPGEEPSALPSSAQP